MNTTLFARFHNREEGMQSLQIVCVIAIAAAILISASQAGRRGVDWMNNRTSDLEDKIGLKQPELMFEPGFHQWPEEGGVKQIGPAPAAPETSSSQYKVVLADGGANNKAMDRLYYPGRELGMFIRTDGEIVQAAMGRLKRNNFDIESIDHYLSGAFEAQTNIHLTEMKKSELNRLVDRSSSPTVDKYFEAIRNETQPKRLIKKMLQKIAKGADAPATWRLAQNLTLENWGKLMAGFDQLSVPEQLEFARRFGKVGLPEAQRIKDGYKKLAAVTLLKSLQKDAMEQTKSAREIAKILEIASKLPMPKVITESFSAYARVLKVASESIAKMMTSPDKPKALTQKILEATEMNVPLALEIYAHLRDVYRGSPSKEKKRNLGDIPDHPRRKL